jgi:hypothetical protein
MHTMETLQDLYKKKQELMKSIAEDLKEMQYEQETA